MSKFSVLAKLVLLLAYCCQLRSAAAQDMVKTSRAVPDSIVAKLQSEKTFEYANDPAYWTVEVHEPGALEQFFVRMLESGVLRWVFYIGMGALLLFAFYRIAVANNLLFAPASRRRKMEAELSPGEITDWHTEIGRAEAGGDFRLAVRFHYLRLLHELSDRGAIVWHPESTNHAYLQMMRSHPRFPEFRFLTTVYEYTWYGEFALSPDRYTNVAGRFLSFNPALT